MRSNLHLDCFSVTTAPFFQSQKEVPKTVSIFSALNVMVFRLDTDHRQPGYNPSPFFLNVYVYVYICIHIQNKLTQ